MVARAANGAVRVVYLTSGEGYPEGVKAEEGVAAPSTANYREYGQRREREHESENGKENNHG